LGSFTRRWQSGWWDGKLSLKLMRGKDLIKESVAFLRACADQEKIFLKLFIFCRRKKGKERKKNAVK
jgi:hypothetical protein